ncbi:MAG: peptidoglycan DD-metalloendopeptidase family protein [Candidatus Woykebacteria bacterium]
MAEEEEKSEQESGADQLGRHGARKAGEKLGGKMAGKEAGKQAGKEAVKQGGKQVAKEGLKKAAAAAGPEAAIAAEVADQAFQAVRHPLKYLQGVVKKAAIALGVIAALILIPIVIVIVFIVVIISVFIMVIVGGIPEAEAGSVLAVQKTPNVASLPLGPAGSTAVVTYTIVVTNEGESDVTNIQVVDPQCAGTSYTISQLAAGESDTRDIDCTVPTDMDIIYSNDVTVEGNLDGQLTPGEGTGTVIIGDPPEGPPAYAPLKAVYCSGSDFWPTGTPNPGSTYCPGNYYVHEGIDIATTGGDWNVYSPFSGLATVTVVHDDGECGNCYGQRIELSSGPFKALFAHLQRGSVTVGVGDVVNTSTPLAIMDDTGASLGSHVHYELELSGSLVDPKDYGALKPHP